MKQYFEFNDDKSSKFWEVIVDGCTVITRYGKIGADGATSSKDWETEEEAEKEAQKLINSKVKKGYIETECDDDEDESQWELDENWDSNEDKTVSQLFYNKFHGPITQCARVAVEKALKKLQSINKKMELGFIEIDVSMNWDKGNIEFKYYDEDNDEESQFYTHRVGLLLKNGYTLMEHMEENGATPYEQALSNFFEDAGLSDIDEKLLKGLSFCLDVSEVGGSYYMEVTDGEYDY